MSKNLGQVLVEKYGKKNMGSVKTASKPVSSSLPFTAEKKDLEFIDKLAAGLPKKTEKTAAGGPAMLPSAGAKLLQSALPSTLMGALSGVGGAAVGAYALGSVYDSIRDTVKSYMAYNQMFDEFPMLKELPREQVDKYWNVLSDFAPKLTTNPLVAGQFIENMANYGIRGIEHNVAGQLLQIQNSARQSSGVSDALKMIGGIGLKGMDVGLRSEQSTDLVPGAEGLPGGI